MPFLDKFLQKNNRLFLIESKSIYISFHLTVIKDRKKNYSQKKKYKLSQLRCVYFGTSS